MLKRKFKRRFLASTSGNFAAMFAISLVPLLAGAGMMLDYTNLSRKQSDLQNTVDAAILMAGAHYLKEGRLPRKRVVIKMLRANHEERVKISKFAVVGDQIVLEAKIDTDPIFLDILGQKDFAQSADATVPVSVGEDVEIALVLDTTGSMAADNKMVDLKRVATDFVRSALDKAPPAKPSAVKIGLVPFADYVNVGLSNRNAPWINVPADEVTTSCYMTKDLISKSGCTTTTTNHPRVWVDEQCYGPSYSDGVQVSPGGCNPGYWRDAYTSTSETCTTYDYGPEYEVCNSSTQQWYGCVGSRQPALNVRDRAYANRVPGLLGFSCTSPIRPLTSNESALVGDINAFSPSRNTYIGTGVSWGHRVLSSRSPYQEGARPNEDAKKFMIVMSDGDNTMAPERGANNEWHTSTDTGYANEQTRKACDEARKQDITIYSIAFGTTITADGKKVLEQCAGDSSRYFPAADAKALEDAFDAILENLFKLRLTS